MEQQEVITEIALVGGGGEPVDLWRTLRSHGLVGLPPAELDPAARSMTVTLGLPGGARTVRIVAGSPGTAAVHRAGASSIPASDLPMLTAQVRQMLRLDADLSPFYQLAGGDEALAWVAAGTGQMAGGVTVFEDLIKTVCTTNCAWSGTLRMVSALVEHLGEPAPDAPASGWRGRAFPTPAAMAARDEAFYRETIRAGYRARYLTALAEAVASGELALETLRTTLPTELPDDEVYRHIVTLLGIGPYAAAHVMVLLGRASRLILDSWTRPSDARLAGLPAPALVPDTEIIASFAPYGQHAGLAFWLTLTRDWVTTEADMG